MSCWIDNRANEPAAAELARNVRRWKEPEFSLFASTTPILNGGPETVNGDQEIVFVKLR
jgi:hypothetical protein